MGVKFERRIAAALPGAIHGQWFEYFDSNGKGYCQTDFLFAIGDIGIGVLESKYTWTPDGHQELENLYLPVVENALSRPTWGMVVSRRVLPDMTGIKLAVELDDALESAIDGNRVCLHWLGEGKIFGSEICRPLPVLEMMN